jgi:hypothetical protein
MSKKIKYTGQEIVFTVENPEGLKSCSKGEWTKHDKDSTYASRWAYDQADLLAKKVRNAFGPYEEDLKHYTIRTISEPICEHCGSHWTESSPEYNGGCCDADEANNAEAA